jgi:hypothetical protein
LLLLKKTETYIIKNKKFNTYAVEQEEENILAVAVVDNKYIK